VSRCAQCSYSICYLRSLLSVLRKFGIFQAQIFTRLDLIKRHTDERQSNLTTSSATIASNLSLLGLLCLLQLVTDALVDVDAIRGKVAAADRARRSDDDTANVSCMNRIKLTFDT